MDLKFKKLLLLAMWMNDANNLVIKASPKKIINLQIFASVLTSFVYNIIIKCYFNTIIKFQSISDNVDVIQRSFSMLKITNTKNEISE